MKPLPAIGTGLDINPCVFVCPGCNTPFGLIIARGELFKRGTTNKLTFWLADLVCILTSELISFIYWIKITIGTGCNKSEQNEYYHASHSININKK